MKAQAELRLAGIEQLLATPIGEKVFPEGKDLSQPIAGKTSGSFRD